MKILLKAHLIEEAKAIIEKCGEIEENIEKAEVVIVRGSTKVDKRFLDKARSLKAVIRAGVGLDNIDVEECRKRGIKVFNTPTASTNAVAELTIALMIGTVRKLYAAHCTMKKGEWHKKKLIGEEVEGKTLGILGYGRIGSKVGEKARALGMNVVAHSRTKKEGVKNVGFEELFKKSDIVSVHLPLTPNTKNLIGKREFSIMKKGAYFINTARGEIVDEEALFEACQKKLSGAALDVYREEPYKGKLLSLNNVFFSCHLGGYTKEAQIRIAEQIKEILKDF